ncbi:hypothetical protein WH47_02413 [Habropoda laboriosa]|uniref:Uncharacterized protein n=1 Tax=Habropoda laboriosa TaxID=597456 RepID=A0A0L7RKP1_9HYME|nr:hypothetical protein WH47_02413 [Habropoda laboriosa]
MKEHIRTACANINDEAIRRARESFEIDGHHFEHLLIIGISLFASIAQIL